MWLFNGEEIRTHEDLLPDCKNIVYIIKYTDGRKYIGKKTVRSVVKRPPLAGKKRNRRVMTNHPFANYEGSHDKPEGIEIESKIILYQCATKTAATYLETALLIHHNAIFTDEYLNKNIGGTFYDNVLDGLLCTNSEDAY